MSIKPIKTWSYPGALLDALVDTRKAVADIELPIPTEGAEQARALVTQTLDQLDHLGEERGDGLAVTGLARDGYLVAANCDVGLEVVLDEP